MQHAQVIVNHSAGQASLTYSIPADFLAQLAVGSVVLVPLGPAVLPGVITGFIRRVGRDLAAKLRPIASVVYAGPMIEPAKQAAASELNRTWGIGVGRTLWRLLPEVPRRPQPIVSHQALPPTGYTVLEYEVALPRRAAFYHALFTRLKPGLASLLVVTATNRLARELGAALSESGDAVAVYPDTPTARTRRQYWLDSLTNASPKIYLGPRGIFCVSTDHLGTIATDEPWLPGHKDDAGPKLWSLFVARALARERGVPLVIVSSRRWPESQLVAPATSQPTSPPTAEVIIVPPRPLAEQIDHWLTELNHQSGQIVVHQTRHELMWCERCHRSTPAAHCAACGHPTTLVGYPTLDAVRALIGDRSVAVTSPEPQLTSYMAILALNFDAYLAVTDWRAGCYLATKLRHLTERCQRLFLVTAHPDVWTKIIAGDKKSIYQYEDRLRLRYHLPPYSLTVELRATSEKRLIAASRSPDVITASKISRRDRDFSLTLQLKPTARLPAAWSNDRRSKLDILPLYLEP